MEQTESAAEMLGKQKAESAAAAEKVAAEKAEAKPAPSSRSGGGSRRGRGSGISNAAWNSADDIAAAIAPRGKKQMARTITNALKSVFRGR